MGPDPTFVSVAAVDPENQRISKDLRVTTHAIQYTMTTDPSASMASVVLMFGIDSVLVGPPRIQRSGIRRGRVAADGRILIGRQRTRS